MSLAVRNDTLAALAGTDGDYAPLQVNATGALFIQEGSALDVSAATVTVDGSGVTQPVSAASLPLPSGAATAANQSTGNTALSAIRLNYDMSYFGDGRKPNLEDQVGVGTTDSAR